MKLENVLAGALFAGLLAVGVTFGSAAMAQGNHQQYGGDQRGGGQQLQQGRNEAQQNGYYGSSSGYAPRPGWRWQPQQCWIERIPGSGLGPQRVCR
jgi:hypothetical protein